MVFVTLMQSMRAGMKPNDAACLQDAPVYAMDDDNITQTRVGTVVRVTPVHCMLRLLLRLHGDAHDENGVYLHAMDSVYSIGGVFVASFRADVKRSPLCVVLARGYHNNLAGGMTPLDVVPPDRVHLA